jgi:hypothetical protein
MPRDLPQLQRMIVEAVAAIDRQMLQRVWQELDYRIDICRVTKGGNIEHLKGRTETWSVSPSVDMLPFGVNITASVPQRSEIPEGLMNYPCTLVFSVSIFPKILRYHSLSNHRRYIPLAAQSVLQLNTEERVTECQNTKSINTRLLGA